MVEAKGCLFRSGQELARYLLDNGFAPATQVIEIRDPLDPGYEPGASLYVLRSTLGEYGRVGQTAICEGRDTFEAERGRLDAGTDPVVLALKRSKEGDSGYLFQMVGRPPFVGTPYPV